MKNSIYSLAALLLFVGIGACDFSVSGDRGFHTTDKEYMELLIKELDSEGVSYRIESNGYIMYPARERARFEKIQARVGKAFYPFPHGGGRVHSTDPEYMRLIKKELDSVGVKYKVNREGYIAFSKADKPRFKSIDAKIRRLLYEGIRIRIDNKAKRERLISVLKKEGVEHTLLNREDGIWVRWYPKDEKHKEAIWSKLKEFACSNKEPIKTKSKKDPQPNNSFPNDTQAGREKFLYFLR